jgi:hypothetical protein
MIEHSRRLEFFPILNELMERILHLCTTVGNHMQMIQIKSLQLLQQVHLFVQVLNPEIEFFNLLFDHRNAIDTFLQFILDRHDLLFELLVEPD